MNALPRDEAIAELLQCCGAHTWAERMADARPFSGRTHMLELADAIWCDLAPHDWLEAFRSHPRIGERVARDPGTRESRWTEQEQEGARRAATTTLAELAELNRAYEQHFGHIFLICATGRSGEEMLEALRSRIDNEPDVELRVAAEEQRKITRIRLEKLL